MNDRISGRDDHRQFLEDEAKRIHERLDKMDSEDDKGSREEAQKALVGTCWKRDFCDQVDGPGAEYYMVTGIDEHTGRNAGTFVRCERFLAHDNGTVEFPPPGKFSLRHSGDSLPLTPEEYDEAFAECVRRARARHDDAKLLAKPRSFVERRAG